MVLSHKPYIRSPNPKPNPYALVLDAEWLDLEPDDAAEVRLDVLVVEDGEADVVVEEKLLLAAVLNRSLETNRETTLIPTHINTQSEGQWKKGE